MVVIAILLPALPGVSQKRFMECQILTSWNVGEDFLKKCWLCLTDLKKQLTEKSMDFCDRVRSLGYLIVWDPEMVSMIRDGIIRT